MYNNGLLLSIPTGLIVTIIVLVVTIAIFVVLYFLGKRAQKKQDEQKQIMESNKQYVTMLVIDKKKLPITKSGLPQQVIEQTPKYLRWQKLPVIKAKVGAQMVTMIADNKVFDTVPLKKEIKAGVSGLYLVDFKGAHGKIATPEPKKKKGFARFIDKLQEKAGAKPIK